MSERGNPYWPPETVLTFGDGRGNIWLQTTDRHLDLADYLMGGTRQSTRVVHLAVSTGAHDWDRWDEATLQKLEAIIRHGLEFDGYKVRIVRKSKWNAARPTTCFVPFQWRLHIRS